jgi:hypothetical protein
MLVRLASIARGGEQEQENAMALDLWFREDVARILASAHETMQASTAGWSHVNPRLATAYQKGFDDALRAVGIAFGVATPASPKPARPSRDAQIVEVEGYCTCRDRGGSRA